MANATVQCNCLAGTAYIDANGKCGCVNNYMYDSSAGALPTKSNPYGTVSIYTPNSAGAVTNASSFNLVEWLKNHKWLVIGGLAAILFFYMRGGGFTSREVVSTTRYGKK